MLKPITLSVLIALVSAPEALLAKTKKISVPVTYCDKLVAWQPSSAAATTAPTLSAEADDVSEGTSKPQPQVAPVEKRARTRPAICSQRAGDGVWIRAGKVHSSRQGRGFWLWLPRNDAHLTVPETGGQPVLKGWQLQVRPLGFAHEIYLVPAPGEIGGVAAPADTCPRPAIGKRPGQRYCLQSE